LNWTTATETNNAGFSVERKGIEGNWTTLGFVNGHGNSTEINNYIFTDRDVPYGNYTYRLKQTNYDGTYKYSAEVNAEVLPVTTFSLMQNYPNPFNPSTSIKYSLPSEEFVTLKVFDILGREVTTLVNQKQGIGEHTINFDASRFNSGVYFYSIRAGKFTDTKKMLLTK
jgi:hypothetical protein